jgi:hypothetical protein
VFYLVRSLLLTPTNVKRLVDYFNSLKCSIFCNRGVYDNLLLNMLKVYHQKIVIVQIIMWFVVVKFHGVPYRRYFVNFEEVYFYLYHVLNIVFII